jgi:FAD/FMN-containing dehydrogenase
LNPDREYLVCAPRRSRATIGGMVGNNSCGARSLRYGNTRENVLSIDAIQADGISGHFGPALEPGCGNF